MDLHFENDIQRYKKLIAQTPEDARPFLIPLAPKRQKIMQHNVTARLQWQQEKTTASQISLGVQMLNLSADLSYQRSTENDSTFSICIERTERREPHDES